MQNPSEIDPDTPSWGEGGNFHTVCGGKASLNSSLCCVSWSAPVHAGCSLNTPAHLKLIAMYLKQCMAAIISKIPVNEITPLSRGKIKPTQTNLMQ